MASSDKHANPVLHMKKSPDDPTLETGKAVAWTYLKGPQGEELRHNGGETWQYRTIFGEWRPWPPTAPAKGP